VYDAINSRMQRRETERLERRRRDIYAVCLVPGFVLLALALGLSRGRFSARRARKAAAAALAKAIQAIPGLDLSSTLLFGGCASASRDAGVTLQFVAEALGIGEFFMAVDELKLADDDTFTVLERVEGGQYQSSTCAGFPAAIGWATGSLPEPPNNPQTGMMNMRGVMPALMKAPAANVGTGGIAYAKAEVPAAKRDTVVKKDMTADAIAAEIVEWIKQ
jgi:electron transfer flavoprotein beta subunit